MIKSPDSLIINFYFENSQIRSLSSKSESYATMAFPPTLPQMLKKDNTDSEQYRNYKLDKQYAL